MSSIKPLQWISWFDARVQMGDVYCGWRGSSLSADKAMLNALRRGRVPCRGSVGHVELVPCWGSVELDYSGWVGGGRHIGIEEVLPTLRRISLYSDQVPVEYDTASEISVSESPLHRFVGNRTLRLVRAPPTLMRATIWRPELVWPEFRRELIEFELPAGITPSDSDDIEPAGSHDAESPQRLAYEAGLKIFMIRLKEGLDDLKDNQVAQRYENLENTRIATGKSVLKLPHRRYIANQVAKLRLEIKAQSQK